MSNLEPCFVPRYIPSNVSAEEFIAIARDCLPDAFVERIVAMQDEADNMQIIECINSARACIEKLKAAIPEEKNYGGDPDTMTVRELLDAHTGVSEKFAAIQTEADAALAAIGEWGA